MAQDNISKFYQAFNEKYDNFGSEQEFRDFLKGANRENIDNLYNAFNSAYDNFGSSDEMVSYLGWNGGETQADSYSAPEPVRTESQRRTSRFNEMARSRDAARGYTPEMKEDKKTEEWAKSVAEKRSEPAAPVQSEPTEVESQNVVLPEPTDLSELYKMKEDASADYAFVDEYEKNKAALDERTKGLKSLKGDIRNSGFDPTQYNEDSAWLKENEARYGEARKKVDEIEGRIRNIENAKKRDEVEAKRSANRERLNPQEIVARGIRPSGYDNTGKKAENYSEYSAADELYAMAEQTYDQGSKYAPGYSGSGLDKAWTAVSQFVGGAANNIDKGSLTMGLSESHAFKEARNAGEKKNAIITDTYKQLGYTDESAGKLIESIESDGLKLSELTKELDAEAAEIGTMEETYKEMVSKGDPKAQSYAKEVDKRIKAYNKRVNDEYKPAYESYEKNSREYETLLSAVEAATDKGLTDGEKEVLDAFDEYLEAKMRRSDDVSVASKAGAGAEQSAEFMLDFILTGGISKAATKAATKLTTKSLMKKLGREAVEKMAVKPTVWAQMGADVAASAARTAVMFPRNLAAYGEQLTQMTGGKDSLGRYQFDRTRLNAALNTALTQYIEYWSEGFGEYFGAGEQWLFKQATKLSPRTAIGKTLGQYRGSIGKYLDYGKFDGMFNEMVEEVVGSGFNALAGWMSGDRVGDSEAMKDFFSGEQLATLALSFLPMSAISAGTNLRAYNRMRERYNKGAEMLNGYVESGAVNREELDELVSKLPDMTPEEIKDKVVSIADGARKQNNGRLPEDFSQNLMGYLEGSFAMNLRNDEWESSANKMAVVNAYTNQYEVPDVNNAYDLAQEESAAKQAAVEAGFSEQELEENDAYLLAQKASALETLEPERSQALMGYAVAKAQSSGLKDGYDEETKQIISSVEEPILNLADNNGKLTTAQNADGQLVYLTSKDAKVENGSVVAPTGPDGLVTYLDEYGNTQTAKANTLSGAQQVDTETYLMDMELRFRKEREEEYQQALNAVSSQEKAESLVPLVNHTILIEDAETGEVSSVTVLGVNRNTGMATIKDASGRGPSRSISAELLYDSAQKDENGGISLDVTAPDNRQDTGTTESETNLENLIGTNVAITDRNGEQVNAFVTEVGGGNVSYEYQDAEGNTKSKSVPVAEFQSAMQGQAAPAATQAPAAEPETGGLSLNGRPVKVFRIDENNGWAYFTYADVPGSPVTLMGLDEFKQKTGYREETATTPAPEVVEETPAQETAQGEIPIDEATGEPIYDAEGVTPEQAYNDIYGRFGEDTSDADSFVVEQSDAADKALKKAKKAADKADAQKAEIDKWKRNPGEGLNAFAKRKADAKAEVDEKTAKTTESIPELQRKSDFWKEIREVAEANIAEAKAEAERQKLIEQYGVDTSGFNLEPQTMEEALADGLAKFFKGGGRLSLGSVLDLVGWNKLNDLRKGGYGFVLSRKPEAVPVDKFVLEIADEYPGYIKDEQDAINMVGELLMRNTRGELGQFIFNNRLNEARNQQGAQEGILVEETPVEETVVEEAPVQEETPAEEPQTTTGEPVEDLPEDLPEETVEEEPVPETPAEEVPVEEPAPAPVAEEGTPAQEPENKPENTSETQGNSVTSQEGESGAESTYGSSNKVISKERYDELRKKMLAKLKGQANAGFDPEIFAWGVEMAAYHIEAGARKFVDFAKRMIADLTDAIRPYLKGIYNGARDLPGMEDYKGEMDSFSDVEKIDINADFNNLSDEQDSNADIQQGEGGVSEPVADTDGGGSEEEPGGNDNGADTGTPAEGGGEGGNEVGELDGGNDSEPTPGTERPGANGTPGRGGRGRSKSNDGGSTGRSSKGNRPSGQRESGNSEGVGRDSGRVEETDEQKEAKAKAAEDAAYEAEKERIKDETDTKKLKSLLEELKAKLTGITDVFDVARAKLVGQLRAIREKLQELFSNNANKSEALSQEKVPYSPVSDSTGEHAIGSVVPSGSADYMRDALKRLEAEVGKPVAEYVKDELGYKSLDEMFTSDGKDIGLSAEQVDAVGLAIHQIKTGRVFIVGDMTGVGKGRVAAAIIRWGKKNKKKVIFCTEQPNLFSAMNADLEDIGSAGMVPFIINNSAEANITNSEGTVIVRHPAPNVYSTLFESGKDELPICQQTPNKGKQYDFVMTTYSQLQASEEEEEGDSDKVKKKNERNKKGRQRLNWLKNYAKDAVLIMDESHTAAGEGSTRGENAKKLVEAAQGVTFLSATFAKTPESMSLYAIRSSMNDAMITRDQLIAAISKYGIPMQEILAASLFKTGEMVRRERDFDGVKTNWLAPDETYSKEEIETTRGLSDRTVGVINSIIDFQRRYVEPVIRKMNEPLKAANEAALKSGASDVYLREYDTTPYSGQVSNVVGMMLFALKAKKAAELAIEQIKRGEKPVIAVDNTLGAYVDQIEGNIESADFGAVLMKGLAFALRYQLNTNHMKLTTLPNGMQVYKKVEGDRQVEKFESIEHLLGENGADAIKELATQIEEYGRETLAMDLPLSPIDYIIKKIHDAGYKCGEITKRQNALVQNEDGTWTKKPIKHNKKDVINRFNGGTAKSPLPKAETYDAVVMNRSGATGNSMHASRRFGDQRPRKMIILQAAKDPNNEVQIRGRIDRTGQVVRGEYFYVISPIPAEKKITMMLKQKLASLDATSVGSEKVASNRVEAEDMDNKYGDEVARDFLVDHEEIHLQMDPAKQMKKNRRTGEYVGRPGLLYDLLLSMQRMTCAEQEMILNELEESYAQKIEYLNQNGINDLATTTMNLDATTVDKAIMVKGKDNDALSEFAHDTSIERMEVNVLRKPMRSEDIWKKVKELGGLEKHTRTNSWGETEDVSYGDFVQQNARDAVSKLKDEKKAKQAEAEEKLAADIREEMPKEDSFTEEQYEEAVQNDPRLASLRLRNMNEYSRYEMQLDEQLRFMRQATSFFMPGRAYLVPLNESEGAQNMYGRFLGYKAGKDGRPKSVEAVFATKDSRAMVSIPLINMHKIIDTIRTNSGGWTDIFGKSANDYASEEARLAEYDMWWDRMIPANTSRSIRYMITGNILQAAGSLASYRGTITTFTRKDAETGEVTVDKGLLLAEDFDPENFVVRTEVTKEDVWETPGEFSDPLTNIAVFREGDRLAVKFTRERGSRKKLSDHPVMSDDEFKALCVGNEIIPYGTDELRAYVNEENAAEALDYLYKNYGFTQGHLLVMPDSTEKPDRIVYTNKPYRQVIDELQPKYRGVYGASSAQREIDKALKTFKMDVTNEDLKEKIRELVQLRQAYNRRDYANLDDADLATQVIIAEQKADKLAKAEPNESPEDAKTRKENRNQYIYLAEAFKEELGTRGYEKEGHLKHYKQGKTALDTMIDAFDEFNTDEENAKIAKRVFDIMRKLNANYFFDEKASEDLGGQTRGDYVGYNWRYMNEAWVADQLKANTILHEMLHTATVYPFEAMQRAADHLVPNVIEEAKQAEALFRAINQNKAFRHQIGEDSYESYTDYGVRKNAKELLAETGANQKFRDDLAKVKVLVRVVNSFGQTAYQFSDVTDNPTATGGTVMSALDAAMDILDRMLNAFDPEAYRKVWAGTGYGEMSYREAGPKMLTKAESDATSATLDRMGEELGVKINKVSRSEMPAGHSSDKGYYNPATGEMTICMDNVTDERDAIATVLHETVGHKGLRELFGPRFREAMKNIYAALDAKGRAWVNSYITRHNLGFGNEGIIRGMEEYLSHLAESGDFKDTVWGRIKEVLGKIVDLVFGTDGFVFTDRELNYILRASYEHLKDPNWLNTVPGKAKDTLWKRELGINETDPNRPTDPDGPGTGILFRDGDTGYANEDYNNEVELWQNKAIIENQNADLPVKIGMDKVMKETGKDTLSDDEDYLTRHNLASSRAETEAHNFELFHFRPMLEQVRAIQSALLGGKTDKDSRQKAYERVLDYIYAVSGLERNAYKNAEIEHEKQNLLQNETDPDKIAKITAKYDAMKKDWSGITSLMGRPAAEWQEAEADAQDMVDAFKREVGNDAMLDTLWDRIRSCTDFSLEHAYRHGLLTRDEFEKLHGTATQPRMWDYYVPLRGFKEDTAEEEFGYSTFTQPSTNGVVVKKMSGRWTKADNPLANILNIAETEIVQGNDNWAKQALYRFTLNAGKNTLLTVTEPWFVKNPATGNWSLAEPYPNESLEDFEARMQALRSQPTPLAKKGRQGLRIDKIMVNKAHQNEHLIKLKVAGMDKMVWVNGNPALAKAVSGIGRAQNMQWLRRASRVLSNLFTTYSLDFSVKNLIRDTIYSRSALIVKEDKAYRRQFEKNWWSNFGYGAFAFPMIRLAAQWESGELQSKNPADRTKREQQFIDFMTDGGQTGYTIINSVNQIKRDLERSMRRAGKDVSGPTVPILGHYANMVKTLNEGFELLTRFTAYQTSRDMGRSGQRSASDAKEISVNFNRRGAQSGNGVWGNIAAYLGATHYFYNAGVQGFDNFLRLYKSSPKKMGAITAGIVMMGILTPLINSMLAGAAGGGDDDWYWNLPEWVRRNNLVIGWPEKEKVDENGNVMRKKGAFYLCVPLPVEFRAIYGLGDIAASAFAYQKYPNRSFGRIAGDMISTAAGILPVNPVEGYTGNGNLGDAALRAVAPDAGMFFVDWATNRDYTGRPLWKDNPFSDTVPKSQGAYASTPKGIVNACQKLAEVSAGAIDVPPGLVRDFMNNYGGGFFRAAEDVSKMMTGAIGNDPERPFRWDNVPFFSGFTGHIDEDRSNSFATNALREYKDISEEVVKKVNAICNTKDITAAMVYGDKEIPEEYASKVRVQRILSGKDYELGKMYRDGMNNQYKMKQYVRGEKAGQWYKSKEIERVGVDGLKKAWRDLREEWASMPSKTEDEKSAKAEKLLEVQDAWHEYYNAEADLAERLMDYEYGKK